MARKKLKRGGYRGGDRHPQQSKKTPNGLPDYFKDLNPQNIDYIFGEICLIGKGFELPLNNDFFNRIPEYSYQRFKAHCLIFPEIKWERVYVKIETAKKKFNWKKIREDPKTSYTFVIFGKTDQGIVYHYRSTPTSCGLFEEGKRQYNRDFLVFSAFRALILVETYKDKERKLKSLLTSDNKYLRQLAKEKLKQKN